jgi:PAS domain S-box-containing protein
MILEAVPNAIVVTDAHGRIGLVNVQTERLFGYSRAELVDQSLAVILPAAADAFAGSPGIDGSASRNNTVSELKSKAPVVTRDSRGLRKDGREFPVEITFNSIETPQGRMFLATVLDVSERRHAEERFRLAIESAPSGMVMVDAGGRIVLVNSQTEKLFGYSREELVGQPVELLVPERARQRHATARAGFLQKPETRPMGHGRELFARRKDGSEFPVEIGLNPIETAEGIFALGAIVDVTERQRLEREVRLRLEDLAVADQRKNEFLAMLSHELRNPLAPMRNAVQLMRTPNIAPEVLDQTHDMLERQLHQMTRLVDDLLDVSRIRRGHVDLRRQTLDITGAVKRGIETAQSVIDAHGHELILSLPDYPLQVDGDPVRLAQVVSNLLTNAAKYTPQPDRIYLTVKREGGEVVLSVRDRGIGIAAEFLPRVFELFQQADSSVARSRGGLGIGLTLVQRLVKMHHGSVTAASGGPDKGSEFTVRLPLSASMDTSASGSFLIKKAALRRRVLVVDDNLDAAESTAMILRLSGHEVRCAYDGYTALEFAALYTPDLILLDIGLPDLTGHEVAKRLRAQPRFQDTTIVAVTGYGQDNDRRRSEEAGITRHMTKPIDPQELTAMIEGSSPVMN